MDTHPPHPTGGLDPRELEAHRPWLLRLAAGLLSDPHLAEDCVQEVLLVAVQRAPARRVLRGWLRQTLVNRARKAIEREAQRRYVEAVAAGRAGARSAESTAFRELQEVLHRSVGGLDERYRRALRLRYERGLPPREIARLLGVPTKTVNSWLYRAHERLRVALGERLGDGRSWSGLVLAWIAWPRTPEDVLRAVAPRGARGPQGPQGPQGPHGPGAAPSTRSIGARALLTAGGVAAAAAVLWLATAERTTGAAERAPAAAPLVAASDPDAGTAERASTPHDAAPERASVAPAAEPPPAAPPPGVPPPGAPPGPLFAGRVIDAGGAPVAGLGLRYELLGESDVPTFMDRGSSGHEEFLQRIGRRFEPRAEPSTDGGDDPWPARSDTDGVFALPWPERNGWVAVEGGTWAVISTPIVLEEPPPADPVVVVAPARAVAGRVLDERGRPLRSVRVELRLPDRFVEREDGMPTHVVNEPSVFTDDDGAFELVDVPAVPDAELRFRRNGYAPVDRPLGELPESGVLVRLASETAGEVLAGRATDAQGDPVEGAFLSLDWTVTATSDERGEFWLEVEGAAERAGGVLRAAARGYLPLELAVRPDGAGWSYRELVFEREALDLTGVVLRADGTPHPHAAVWAPRPATLALPPALPPVFAEHVMSGPQDGGSLEATIADEDGVFRLLGLRDAEYRFRVVDLDTRAWFETEPIRAGVVGVVLQFPPIELCEVTGTVVDRRGVPVAGARVARAYPRLDVSVPGGKRFQTRFTGEPVVTDAEGRFRVGDVARANGQLVVYGEGLQSRKVELSKLVEVDDLRVVVARACAVVVERGPASPPFDAFAFLTDDGRPLPFRPAVQGIATPVSSAAMEGERSDAYVVYDLAAELVLLDGGRIAARVPVELAAESENVLRP